MSKEIKFNVKLEVDGKEHIVTALTDVKKFAESFEEARNVIQKGRDDLIKFTQVSAAFQNMITGLQQLTGALGQFSTAAAAQEEVETKLATNMRNTMNARQEDIQSIYDLCSAQQQLGVIGDEIQLAGAQELATYLEKKSSLEKLIPVMNDMIAQQYGLNATSEAAANIATMLGKVMDGQTGALSRYGYKFDEVQEQILKFGTEEQRAAVLAEVVESAVGGMNAELANTASGKAKQAANDIGDFGEKIGQVIAPLENAIISVGEIGRALSGLGTVITGGISVYKGLKEHILSLSVALKSSILATYAQAAASKVSSAATALWANQVRFANRMQIAWAFGAKTFVIRAVAMRAAITGLMAVTGVGLAIAALGSVISLFSSKTQKATDEMKRAEQAADDSAGALGGESYALTQNRAQLELNIARLKEFSGTKEQEKKIVSELNSTYGETMGYFSSVSDWYKALTANSEAYCLQMQKEAQMRALSERIAEKELENRDIRSKIRAGKYSTKREYRTEQIAYTAGGIAGANLTQRVEVAGSSELDKANAQIKQNEASTAEWQRQLKEVAAEAAKIEMPVIGSAKPKDFPQGKDVKKTVLPEKSKPEKEEAVFGSIKWYDSQLRALRERIEGTADTEAASALQGVYEGLAAQLHELKIKIGIEKPDESETNETLRGIDEIIAAHPLEPLEFDTGKKSDNEGFKSAAEGIEEMGASLASMGKDLELPALNIAGTVAQAVATLALSFADAMRGAAAMGPWGWISFGAAGLAQLMATIAAVKNATAFANGGVVYGPTLGLVGEYAGAMNNPEVIAPLSSLRSLLAPTDATAGEVRFVIEGDKLAGVLQRRNRKLSRA